VKPGGDSDRVTSGLVVGVLGPTGVGKTAVATALARHLGSAVVSCDSMQVYRGFSVLTNQPTAAECEAVRHEMVGVVEASAEFSAAEYASLARPLIEANLDRCGTALVVGGTGLYMRAALAPLLVAPAPDLAVRAELEARAAAEGPAALHQDLARLDEAAAAAIDPRNVRRVVRALEVVLRTGAAWSGREDLWRPRYFHRTLLVGLTLDRAELYRRIDARARLIAEGGAVEEVRRWREATLPAGVRTGITTAIGFAEIERLLDGSQSLDETVEQIAAATRRYARRQLTWLRKMSDLVIIDLHDLGPEDAAQRILALASSGEHVKEPCNP
jgi:tRNA dimethylallyltransferase